MLVVSWPDIRAGQLPGGQIQNAGSLRPQWPEPSIGVNGGMIVNQLQNGPVYSGRF
jgi:hypothetical protein